MYTQTVFGRVSINPIPRGIPKKYSKRKIAKSFVEDVCCEACWNATREKCSCRCGGANHGRGLNNVVKLDQFNREEA